MCSLAKYIHVDVISGCDDPTDPFIPYTSLNNTFFTKALKYSLFSTKTNPYKF